ncbi:hypothetical protein [Nocardia farcinica]|uniref:hypothetical protein n=1 Tax=Nocardia farcinica TaxID=37329 RepID=UPI001895613C|nr:hypothetical protein [Nocardia farcinica]MBF6187606.1 hypothetical protein [Nocardia farcinica]
MARYTDHDEIAAEALQLSEDVRELDPHATFRRLSHACARDPERMAQVLMCLAVWLDPDASTALLVARAERAAALRGAA